LVGWLDRWEQSISGDQQTQTITPTIGPLLSVVMVKVSCWLYYACRHSYDNVFKLVEFAVSALLPLLDRSVRVLRKKSAANRNQQRPNRGQSCF
jgi:hypothetical protein